MTRNDPISRFFDDLLTTLQTEHPRLQWTIDGDDNRQVAIITAVTRTEPRIGVQTDLIYDAFLNYPGRKDAVAGVSNFLRYEIANEIGNYFMGKGR